MAHSRTTSGSSDEYPRSGGRREGGRGGSRDGGRRGGGGGGRRGGNRPLPQLVEVVAVETLTPRMVSVRVHAQDLSRFAEADPAAHIKVFLPPAGQREPAMPTQTEEGRVWPEGVERPAMRTYTPRSYDSVAQTLDVQFVLHGEGPASEWAQRAQPGDKIALGGPGGRFALDLAGLSWWIAGDESAIPAVADILERIPRGANVEVHLEVDSAADELQFTAPAGTRIIWHHRQPRDWGVELVRAARSAAIEPDRQYWAACEAQAVRNIRQTLLDAGVDRDALVTRGYWRRGVADHPDHDHGED